MHVIKQFPTPVFVYNIHRPIKWVNQMPMPMMKINADVFAEIANSVLYVQMVGGIIVRYFNWSLY